mgnify:CR=1 FL=1
MKKSSGKKRVSSLTFLIATTAVLAAVAVLCLFGSNLLYAMRVRNVNEQRAELEKRNTDATKRIGRKCRSCKTV